MTISRIIVASLFGISFTATALPAFAYCDEGLAKDAKISITQAQTIALKAQPGKIVDTELEHEAGGSSLRYSFEIQPTGDSTTHEMGIDAQTGAVLKTQWMARIQINPLPITKQNRHGPLSAPVFSDMNRAV